MNFKRQLTDKFTDRKKKLICTLINYSSIQNIKKKTNNVVKEEAENTINERIYLNTTKIVDVLNIS